MMVFSMTPASSISPQSCVPSRERSPTPAKALTPECSSAIVWIISMMMTVLPTPAPPKTPVLPPRVKGAIRSMTFSPVSKTSVCVDWSTNSGAGRWMGYVVSGTTVSPGSIAWPSTLKIRPNVALPTGTVIGALRC